MKKLIGLGCVALLFSACNQELKQEEPTVDPIQLTEDSLTAELDSIQQAGQLIGYSVAIADQSGTLYAKGFGSANLETKTEYTEHTIQHIASVSKTLIGIALLKAQEMGKLKVDDPIQDYLPFLVSNPNFPDTPITIRHLATHSSGINDTEQYMSKAWIVTENQDLEGISTDYPEQTLNPNSMNVPMETFLQEYLVVGGTYFQEDNYSEFEAGARYSYSNIGATLAALIIEKATGTPYDVFTKEHILKPLKMDATGWSLNDVDVSKHARLYRNDNTPLPFYTAITYPDGMLITSSNDMGKYLSELVKGYIGEGTLLKPSSYAEFFKEQLQEHHFAEGDRNPENPYDEDYSPALFIGHSALGHVGHTGGDAGVATFMFVNKETKTGRFLVINMDMGNDNRAKELQFYSIWDALGKYAEQLKS